NAELTETRHQADTIALHAAGREQLQITADKLLAAINDASRLQSRMQSEIGPQADYRALLQEVSRLAPDSVRMTQITIQNMPEGTEGRMTGYVMLDGDQSLHSNLEQFIDALRNCPLFDRVTLGNVQASQIADRFGQNFQITFAALPVENTVLRSAQVDNAQQEREP
ncbi:MAG TPA: PilN domain-containing protein, partial [Phycisphaerales bacterium]|nr:PilN domain-containing protein [Phycisphaerales bacterium]